MSNRPELSRISIAVRVRRHLFGKPWRNKLNFALVRLKDLLLRLGGKHKCPERLIREPSAFDGCYGIQTAGFVSWRDVATGSWSDAYGIEHWPVMPTPMRYVLGHLPPLHDFTFVELGCGKGRALVIASEFPFKTVVGIEKSPSLATIAQDNATIIRSQFPDRPIIHLQTLDALDYELPSGDLIVFLHDPFLLPVMRKIVLKIERAVAVEPGRRVFIVYYAPRLYWLFNKSPALVADASRCFILNSGEEETTVWTIAVWQAKGYNFVP